MPPKMTRTVFTYSDEVTENRTDSNVGKRGFSWRAIIIMVLVLGGLFSWQFPTAALWIATKLFGAVSATTQVAAGVAVKTAAAAATAAESVKNAAEAELARRLIVQEALEKLTPCDLLRCPSHLENTVKLLTHLKEAQYKASLGDSFLCAPITPSDADGHILLAMAAPWLVQQPSGHEPRAECKTTISSGGDTEETCTYKTDLQPCPGAVQWPKLSDMLTESLKAFNHKLAEKQQEHLSLLLNQADQRSVSSLLGDSIFVPAAPRPSATRVTPYRPESEVLASGEKTVLEKMRVLQEDQKVKPAERFCKKGGSADSTANFCSSAATKTRAMLQKAIKAVEAASSPSLPR